MQLTSMKTGHTTDEHILRMSKNAMENKLIRKPFGYGSRPQKVSATESLGSPGEKRNSFLIVSGGGWESRMLLVAKTLPLIRITNDNMNYGLKRGTEVLKKGSIRLRERFRIDIL